jgi:hypothetical protein
LAKYIGKINKPVLNGYKCADESTVKKYLELPKDNHQLLNLLKNLISFKLDENSNVINEDKEAIDLDFAIKEEIIKKENNVNYDLLKTMFTNERFIRPLLDIILENSLDRKSIKVFLEILLFILL